MANKKVILVRLCKTEKGWRRYPAVFGKNGKPKPEVVLVNGKEQIYPTGRYQIRTYEGRRIIYQDAGQHAGEAQKLRERSERLVRAKNAASMAGVKLVDSKTRLVLRDELERFIQATEDRGSNESAVVYRRAAEEFLAGCEKIYADELQPEDISKYQRTLRKRGCSDRTIHNRHCNLLAFLRSCKLNVKELAPLNPRFEQALPEIYSPAEMKAFFAVIDDLHLVITFEVLLKCGLREREAMFLEWSSVDCSRNVVRVRSNSRFKFKVKDHEQRDLPIPPELVERLMAYKEKHPGRRLVMGTKSDRPNHKLLRTLKRLVHRFDLDCKVCDGCKRTKEPECEQWFLHKFRATYITTLLRSGMDLRTVMKFSGHSDLKSVMRYLRPAEDEMVQEHIKNIRWM